MAAPFVHLPDIFLDGGVAKAQSRKHLARAGLERIAKSYGDLQIFDDVDLMIRRKERWCVMGVNGAGSGAIDLAVTVKLELIRLDEVF